MAGLPQQNETLAELPDAARKGRGAVSNRSGRYEAGQRLRTDDGWDAPAEDDLPALRTTVAIDASRTVIARNDSPDLAFDQSINPYRGCEHGCVYCFARPTHAYLGLSPGLDFETKLLAKPDAPAVLRRELAHPRYRPSTIAMGTNTDPYQPTERRLKITRGILEVLAEHRHPVTIVTKSALVLRDLDILAPMAADGLASVGVSVTTMDGALARTLEPRASTPPRRLAALAALVDAGIPVRVMVAPVIPALTDHELEAILARAAGVGVAGASYILLRLPLEIKDLFREWLEAHAPDRAARVLNRMRAMRDGRLYVDTFGSRMRGTGRYADLLEQRFHRACNKHGLNRRDVALDASRFRRPPQSGDQLTLL